MLGHADRKQRRNWVLTLFVVVTAFLSLPILGGGPRSVNGTGAPMAWPTGPAITYNPDPGTLGTLSNVAARDLVSDAFAVWQAASVLSFSEGSLLSEDVDAAGDAATNPAHWRNFWRLDGDALSPVIFDADGSIMDSILGAGARFDVLGLGGVDTPVDLSGTILGGSILINGAFYDGQGLPASPEDVSETGLLAVMVHEVGHFLNLDHSVLNHELALDGNGGNDIYVPTMFPVAVTDEEQLATLNSDDIAALRSIYEGGATTGLSGSVEDGGAIPFQGANVVLRRSGDPLMTAYSFISGGLYFPCNPGGPCEADCGACTFGHALQGFYDVSFVDSGSYSVCVEQMDTRLSLANGNFLGPLATPPIMPGPEECASVVETALQSDDPDDAATFAATLATVDVVLNDLPLSDPNEPNDTFPGTLLRSLPGGPDTGFGILAAADRDIFNFAVVAGQRLRIDLEAAELGSGLDAVVGFYDDSNNLVALADDSLDPDSHGFSFDPALELTAGFTGTGKIVVSAFPDVDQDGTDGATTGAYWLRVRADPDTDGDGAVDSEDICPTTAKDDADRDGLCFGADNCPTESNPGQGAPVKISDTLTTNGNVWNYGITWDEQYVVYMADQDNDEVYEIYSVPIEGGSTPVKICADLGATEKDIWNYWLPTDASKVVYMADQDTDEIFELYTVATTGGAITKISGSLVANGDVLEFRVSPDALTVVFRADKDSDGVNELYSVSIDGGTVTKISGAMTPGGGIPDPPPGFSTFLISEDSARVIYAANQDDTLKLELYSVAIGGGTVTKLNDPLVVGGNIQVFRLPSTSSRVVYLADQDTDELPELYSVPIAGGTVVKMNAALPGSAAGVIDFLFTADGVRVVYTAEQDTAGVLEVYSILSFGGPSTKLNDTLVANGNVIRFVLPVRNTDGLSLTYMADQDTDEVFELYGVPITGGTAVKLNGSLVADGDVVILADAIFNSTVLYAADQEVDEKVEAYSVPVGGGTPTKMTGTMIAEGDFLIGTFNENTLAYAADKDVDEFFELFGVPLQGGEPLKLSAPMVTGGDATEVQVVGDILPGYAVYMADQDTDETFELYSVVLSTDGDADGIVKRCDLCAETADPGQEDLDNNGVGDACAACALDADPDADGICDPTDNCAGVPNVGQTDTDGDGLGNACDDDDDNDGLLDSVETDTGTFVDEDDTGSDPLVADTDGDGLDDGDEVQQGSDPNIGTSLPDGINLSAETLIAGDTGYTTDALALGDVDRDGDLDIVAGNVGEANRLYLNNGTDDPWNGVAGVDVTSDVHSTRSVALGDVDGDGDLDLVVGNGTQTNRLYLNNGTSDPWNGVSGTDIGVDTDDTRAVALGDVDGDGDLDLVAGNNAQTHMLYLNNGTSDPFNGVLGSSVTADAHTTVSVALGDGDGDGDLDLVAGNFIQTNRLYLSNGTSDPWNGVSGTDITAEFNRTSAVVFADVDSDGDLDLVEGNGSIGGPPPVGRKMNRLFLNNGTSDPWAGASGSDIVEVGRTMAIALGDLDGDGDLDLVSGDTTPTDLATVYLNDGNGDPWDSATANDFSNARTLRAIALGDVDGDGDLDIVDGSSNTGQNIAWYENRTIHRSTVFPAGSLVENLSGTPKTVVADVNGDGSPDLVVGRSGDTNKVYLGNGTSDPWNGVTGSDITLDLGNTSAVALGDVDGDGDLDLVTGEAGPNRLYLNNGTSDPWNGVTGSNITADSVVSASVALGDVDSDGDLDLVVGNGLENRLYLNNGTSDPWNGVTGSDITTDTHSTTKVALGDVDSDGDLDLVAGNDFGLADRLYLNNGTSDPWNAVTGSDVGPTQRTRDLALGDVDGDGDLDLVTVAGKPVGPPGGALNLPQLILNNGTSDPWNGVSPIAFGSVTRSMEAVVLADLDGDGDLDMATAITRSQSDRYYLNNGTADPWNGVDGANLGPTGVTYSINAADLDGDGDLDLVVGANSGEYITTYANQGGQFSFATTDTLGGAAEGSRISLLTIDVTSNGLAGDSDLELSTLELLFEEGAGDALSSDEANTLFDALYIYVDDGSGSFESTEDTLVTTVETLELSPQIVEFTPGDPDVTLTPGTTERFFVVVDVAQGAASANPNTFRVTHLTESSSTALDATSGKLLRAENPADLTTTVAVVTGDVAPPSVTGMFPPDQTVDVALATDIVLFLSEPVDPSTVALGVSLAAGGIKIPVDVGVSGGGLSISINPESTLSTDTDYLVTVSAALKDLAGNAAVAFTGSFETTQDAGSGQQDAGDIGEGGGGAAVGGGNANDNSGFANAAAGDIDNDGIDDLVIGAPNADLSGGSIVDGGKATLIFGGPGLQSNAGTKTSIVYQTGTASEFIGETVNDAGDLNDDGIDDLLIGAPQSAGTAGTVYLVFGDPDLDKLGTCDGGDQIGQPCGNDFECPAGAGFSTCTVPPLDLDDLSACSVSTLCGVVFQGEAAGDMVGTALSFAGDINDDGIDDLILGAPGADASAGKAYLIYGPLTAGTVALSTVGSTTPGLIFTGESAGDELGATVDAWQDDVGDGVDDLLIGAPGATANDEEGTPLPASGYVYAVHGGVGPGKLDDSATPGVIPLGRLANGAGDQVPGMLFIGAKSNGRLGRSLSGRVDRDGDGIKDVVLGGNGVAFAIAGDGPKTISGGTRTGTRNFAEGLGMNRTIGDADALEDFGAIVFDAGDDDPLCVGNAGDIDNDGIDDFMIGAPFADGPAGVDAGKAYIVLGSPSPGGVELPLADVGTTVSGIVIDGAEAGDNLGFAVGGGADLNADGVDDALIGAPQADPGAAPENSGTTYVVSPIKPDEVVLLLLGKTGTTAELEWTVPGLSGSYNVYRGTLSTLQLAGVVRTSDMTQLECGAFNDTDDDGMPDTTDSAVVLPGVGFTYLITAQNGAGEGPLGTLGSTPARQNDAQCP